MFQLLTLGGLSLTRAGEPSERSPIQRRQLALLAVLASAGPGGVSRDKLMGLLWPDREMDRARSSLDQALYAARRVCGPDTFIASPTSLALNPSVVASDLAAFAAALAAGDAEGAVRAYGGPFLDGVFISDAAEFERWADGERARLAREYQVALETLAREASARGAAGDAIQWWRRVVDADPLSSRAARGLIEALAAAGDRAGALDFARVHEALVRNELGAPPDPTVASLVDELRRGALPAASQAAATAPSAPTTIVARDARHAVADERDASPVAPASATSVAATDALPRPAATAPARPRLALRGLVIVLLVLGAVAGGVLGWRAKHPSTPPAITLPPLPQASIAVLPFVNMSARPEGDYFSDGMTEELITTLSRLPGLRVAARTSSFVFKGKATDVREIGRELGVATVLEGSIRRTDTRIRISAQLIDARNGYQMWTQEFDRAEGDVFAIQDDIAEAIVSALGTQFNVHPLPLPPRMTSSPETYELYLRARYAWRQRTRPALLEAVRLFREVIRRDPRYGPAYSGLGACYVVLPLYSSDVTTAEMYARADDAATQAMQLDSTLSEPYAILGLVRARRYDWRGAEEAYRTAIARNPNDATAHQWYGKALTQQGRVVEGEREVRRALTLDPFSAVIRYNLGQTLLVARRYDDAAAALEGALAQAPDFVAARTVLGFVRDAQGRPRDAMRELQAVVRSESKRNPDDVAVLAYAYARAGIRDTAQQLLAEALRARARVPRVSATDIALAYLGLGERDLAFTWLERARVEYDSDLEAFVPSPLLDPLRGDPRFVRLETEMHLR